MRAALRSGVPYVWLTGSALSVCLLMVFGLVLLILVNGLGFFWPGDLHRFSLADGRTLLGRVTDREAIPEPGAARRAAVRWRLQVRQGNRDLYGQDFVWVDEAAVRARDLPADALAVERREWGDLYGFAVALEEDGRETARGAAAIAETRRRLPEVRRVLGRIRAIERGPMGDVHRRQERARLALRRLELAASGGGARVAEIHAEIAGAQRRYTDLEAEIALLRGGLRGSLVVRSVDGQTRAVPLSDVVRVVTPNAMGMPRKLGYYAGRVWEFLAGAPRESNTEGGVFPAIFGTVLMVLMMSLLVTPLGVVAALYLREYARQGTVVSAVRVAVGSLAGVPSIVFGVFGVAFFIYFVGGGIDRLFFPASLPTPTYGTGGILWASLTLALLTVPVVIVSTEEGLAALPGTFREASFALGATRFETTWRVVLPAVLPSILTGVILAVARAAGEVAPLMITGVVKLAPALPMDGTFPFFHPERKFMHLGFHIYDVGFQAPNVDAARPMVFATALLLLAIVVALNLGAFALRNHLRRRYAAAGL